MYERFYRIFFIWVWVSFDIKRSQSNKHTEFASMAPPKQIYKCYDCGKDHFRDNDALKKHTKTCKGILGEAQNVATRSVAVIDHVAVNFAPMERNQLQSQSITKVFVDLQGQTLSTVQSAFRVNVADYREMFVAMFKYCWFNNDHPKHHHLLSDLADTSGTSCIVFRKGVWQFTEEISEVRECLNNVAVRFFDIECEMRASMTPANFNSFEKFREQARI